jgi:MFS family permease
VNSPTATAAPRAPALLIALLAIAICINYVDRGNLATAATLIQDELKLSASQLGLLGSAFFFCYVLLHIPAGWLAERYGARVVLAGGVALWSVATGLTSLASSFAMLLGLRFLLGAGESVYFPSSSKLIAAEVPLLHRARANGWVGFGMALGPAVGTYVGGRLMVATGWRTSFAVFGIASLLWLVPWRRLPAPPPVQSADLASAGPSPTFPEILRQRSLWGASLGHFATNYTWYFILSWLPFYLVRERGMSMESMATVAGFSYLLQAVASIASGWATDRWIRQGVSANLIYKWIMGVYHIGAVAATIGVVVAAPNVAIVCLYIYQLLTGISSPGVYAIGQTLAGPRAAGRWIGVQNMIGNVAGIAAPAVTGILVDATHSFVAAFSLAAGVNALGFIGWVIMIKRVVPLPWHGRATASA